MEQLYLFRQRGQIGDFLTEEMDDDAFIRYVVVFANNVEPSILRNPDKNVALKRQIYQCVGRAYFRVGEELRHRIGVPIGVIGAAFREDYDRLETEITKRIETLRKAREGR
jgi:hypothetical protein